MFPLLYSTTVDTLLYIASMHKHEKIGKKTSLVLKPKSEKKQKQVACDCQTKTRFAASADSL